MSVIPGPQSSLRHEAVSFAGVVERNWYLIKRYGWWELAFFFWSLANTLTIVFIAKGIEAAGGQIDVNRATTTLLIGAVIWSYLGLVFEFMTETVAWERWEGTIEYTFMAPIRRPVHLAGVGIFAVLYGVLRSAVLFVVIALMFGLHMPDANFVAAAIVLAIASVSFMGIGTMTSVLPLISPEKGAQLGFIAQGTLLVVSGVYYPVSVLPDWMQWLSTISPATYALRGIRSAILDGAGITTLWGDIWPLIIIGVIAFPLGVWIFRRGEIYAKKHGKLKRSGRLTPQAIRLRHSRRPSRQCGRAGASFSLRSTALAGRCAGRPSSALEMRRTRVSRPASSKIASANSAQVVSPAAARCQTPSGRSSSSRVAAARWPTYVGAVRWSPTTAISSRSRASSSIVLTKFFPVGPNSPELRTIHACSPAAPSPNSFVRPYAEIGFGASDST